MVGNSSYISDAEKQEYYIKCWNKRCKEANISEEDPGHSFMNNLITEINDVGKRKTRYKLNYNREQLIVILFAFLSSVFSGLMSFVNNEDGRKMLGVLGIFIGASIAAINSYTIWKSTKETWLRCSSYRAKLVLETDAFCDDTGEYEKLGNAGDKINLFKDKINILRKEDYSKFFINMGFDFS